MEVRNLQRRERIDRSLLRAAAAAALEAAGLEGARVSFVIVGDRAMSRLNGRFTGRAGPTDVLAFDLPDGDYLGEVVISAGTCRRQAAERGRDFADELALLAAHGVLHLAGLDHTRGAGGARRMRAMERRVLRALGRRP